MTDAGAGGPSLAGLEISDPPGRWAALGFAVGEDGGCRAGGVRLTLGIAPPGEGIVGWSLAGLDADGDVDGLSTRHARANEERWVASGAVHPNGVVAVDHLVVATPDLDACEAALGARGLGFRRLSSRAGLSTQIAFMDP